MKLSDTSKLILSTGVPSSWLEKKLYAGTNKGKPIVIFLHRNMYIPFPIVFDMDYRNIKRNRSIASRVFQVETGMTVKDWRKILSSEIKKRDRLLWNRMLMPKRSEDIESMRSIILDVLRLYNIKI